MIEAKLVDGSTGLVGRLSAKARALAQAHAETDLRARRADPRRWRSARLLWPLFGKS